MCQIGADTHNSGIHRVTAKGTFGITPLEAMHGLKPKLWGDTTDSELEQLLRCTHAGSQAHLRIVGEARNKAIRLIKESKAEYEGQLDKEMNKVRASRKFRVGDIVRIAEHVKGRKARKQSHTHSKKHVVVRVLGYGNCTLQPLEKFEATRETKMLMTSEHDIVRRSSLRRR